MATFANKVGDLFPAGTNIKVVDQAGAVVCGTSVGNANGSDYLGITDSIASASTDTRTTNILLANISYVTVIGATNY
jgi:hypothetical protein